MHHLYCMVHCIDSTVLLLLFILSYYYNFTAKVVSCRGTGEDKERKEKKGGHVCGAATTEEGGEDCQGDRHYWASVTP